MVVRGQQAPLPFFEPASDWRAPDLSTQPSWAGARRVAVDVETKDLDLSKMGPGVRRKGCWIAGYSFAIEDGPSHYVPLRHLGGGNVDAAQGLAYVREQAKHFKGDVCGAGLQYDLDFLEEEGVVFPAARSFRDVQVAAPLINELENSYSLEAIAQRAGIPGKDEGVLLGALAAYGFTGPHPKRGIHALPARLVGPYGEQDSRLPLQLLAQQELEIEAQDLWRVYDLESRVLPILVAMRRRGVRVSLDRLEGVEIWARERQAEALEAVRRETGVSLAAAEVTLPEALARPLRAIGVEPGRTRTGKVSVTAEFLAGIKHPVGDALRLAREMDKLRGTFCASIRRHAVVNPYTGEARIHCTFNQLRKSRDEDGASDADGAEDTEGAAYGRLSCTNPNLQQQPSPDRRAYGKLWRSIYLPDEGKLWGTHDYSQQEPKIAIHLAVLAARAGLLSRAARDAAEAALAMIKSDRNIDFHDMMTAIIYGADVKARSDKDLYKRLRNFCKQIFLGLSYGMGGAKLCRKLGLPTKVVEGKGGRMFEVAGDEGQAVIDKFNARVPFIRETAFLAQETARKRGYVVTLSGRRCRFPRDEQGNVDWAHKAFNRADQGTAADQTKMGLVALEGAGHACQLQVHDEIDLSVTNDEESAEVGRIMEECCPELVFPSRVDREIGCSWGEAA